VRLAYFEDLGFSWREAHGGVVEITFHGKLVTTLKGERAAEFLAEVDGVSLDELQQLLARVTGQFKRGNERTAKKHPRNR
jgi:hypothetical protein